MNDTFGAPKKSSSAEEEVKAAPAHGEALEVLPLQPGDFYMDGPYMVFTEAYHLRRGYCCNSDCRHCPYK
jgi:hypothetical protein